MSDWQKIVHQGVDTLAEAAEKFGPDVIDVDALQPAFENFQMRITPNVLSVLGEPGSPVWQQYVPTTQELDVVDGVIDSLDEDADSPVPNITHRYPDRVLFLVSPVCAYEVRADVSTTSRRASRSTSRRSTSWSRRDPPPPP